MNISCIQSKIVLAICSLFFVQNIFSQIPAQNNPVLQAVKIERPIKLTGKLDDTTWCITVPVELNFEFFPGDNTPAPQKTFVKVLYSENTLYFGFECFDSNPQEIRANITERDNIFQDDFVIVCIDTYGNSESSYELAVNPYGIQGDLLATADGEDPSIDLIWYSKASINRQGWTAEMAIPFSSLSFPDKKEQNWRINIFRIIPRDSRTKVSWMPINRNIPSFMAQAGYLERLENIKIDNSFELLPYVIGQRSGNLVDYEDPDSGFKLSPVEGRIGGGIKYFPNPAFSLDVVLNPDFSQIESDADQIDINTTFALYYEEKRPFFLVGRELLQTPVYYSRSINNPLAAGRIIGRTGSFAYLYLTAYDRNTIIDVPGEERDNVVSTSLNSLVNIGKFRYNLGDESYIGGIVLARNLSGGHNYVAGIDWNYKFWNNWYFAGEGYLTSTTELNDTILSEVNRNFGTTGFTAKFDGEEYSGEGIHSVLSHAERNYLFYFILNNFSPTFQTYNGLLSNVGYRQVYMEHTLIFYPEYSLIDKGDIGFASSLRFNFDNVKKEQVVEPYFSFTLKGQTDVTVSYLLVNDERFAGTFFRNINRFIFTFNSRPLNEISLELNGSVGKFIYRTITPGMGWGHNLSTNVMLKPTNNLNISFSYVRSRLTDILNKELFFDGNIYRLVGIFQYSPEIFFRTIFQFNSFGKTFQFYPLFSYKLNAFTVFYAGATGLYVDYGEETGIRNTDRQYFIKLQYLITI